MGGGTSKTPTFHPVIQEFQQLIEENATIYMGFREMFAQIPLEDRYNLDPAGHPQIRSYEDMLVRLNAILTMSPEFRDTNGFAPCPINCIFHWPMCTPAGLRMFMDPQVNQALKKILNTWAQFLASPDSRKTLTSEQGGWFSPEARKMVPNFEATFECSPTQKYHGFRSWDDFFTRKFRPGLRPVQHPEDDNIISNACESVPFRFATGVRAHDTFWIKGEPYSLQHMLNNDPHTTHFVGGSVYQAYLSPFHYHRWHSPVSGTIDKIVHVPGTYFALAPFLGFAPTRTAPPDPLAEGYAQAFSTHVATRVLVFIRADNPAIGLVCFVGVGMVEVSSCEVTVRVGQRVRRGEEVGMFHYGGSSYCVVFGAGVEVRLSAEAGRAIGDMETTLGLNRCLAVVGGRQGDRCQYMAHKARSML